MNSVYPARLLSDLAQRIDYGLTASASDRAVGPKFLRITDIVPERLDWSAVPFCEVSSDDQRLKFSLRHGDIVIARTGATVGYSKRIVADHEAVFASYLVRVRVKDDCDSAYVGYVVGSNDYKAFIRANAGGAAQPNANARVLTSYPVPIPPLPVQRKIASVLSAYDDLIENNHLQIHALEEMARRIYHEWFVDLRYPGCQDVALLDSELGPLPKGWLVSRMDEVATVIDCLHSKKPESVEDGSGILLQLSNIGSAGILDLSRTYLVSAEDYKEWASRIELRGGDCVITNVGRIAAVAQIPTGVRAAPGRNMTAARPRAVPPTYLLQYLLSEHMAGEVRRKKDAGSIMDSLNVKGIVKLAVPIPGDKLVARFESIVRPVRRTIEVLTAAQVALRATRDLLLPRFISGEVDVADLDIPLSDAKA